MKTFDIAGSGVIVLSKVVSVGVIEEDLLVENGHYFCINLEGSHAELAHTTAIGSLEALQTLRAVLIQALQTVC